MSDQTPDNQLIREKTDGQHFHVTFVELFFDLVFVFAITQLTHALLADLSLAGVAQTALLLLAVWWVWIFTLWVTNWLNPTRTPVRIMLYVLMLSGLLLSASIPKAFGDRALTFAGAYVFMQVGRSLFMVWALRGASPANFRNFLRISAWLALAGVFWIFGALADGDARFAWWIVALAIEYVSPSVGFWTPGLGKSTTADWDVEGGHMAERCGLFIIVALGETILVTGTTFTDHDWTAIRSEAFVTAFVGTVAMWWIYFNIGAERGSEHIATSMDPGRLARLSYTYIHILLVAGIVVSAVAHELVLAHPMVHIDSLIIGVILMGPALFLVGNILFKRSLMHRVPLSHLVGLLLLALLAIPGHLMPPLLLAAGSAVVLVMVAAWETLSVRASDAQTRQLEL